MFRNFKVILQVFDKRFSTDVRKLARSFPDPFPDGDIETRLLKVAVIGVPNAGKSTFINNLMDRKACATSSKVHTTRAKSMAIFTEADSQIVFLDTPGLVNLREQKKFRLERSFLKDSKKSLEEADIIGVIHDASNTWTRERIDIKVIRLLEDHKEKPSFLVLNKVDVLKSKRKLLDLTRLLTENRVNGKTIPGTKPLKKEERENRGWPFFQDIFMVSALTGDGLPQLKNYLIEKARPAKWMFPPEVWSDQSAESIIVDSVKAKLLDFLPQEIPYQLKPELEFFEINDEGAIVCAIVVHCPTERIARLVGGVSDGKLRQMTESVQNDLQETFQNYVRIKIVLKAPEKE